MTLANWTSGETVDDTRFNEMVNDVPSTLCLVITPRDSEFRGETSESAFEVGRLRLRPVQGRYLHIRHELKSTDGSAAVATYALEHAAGGVDLWAISGITSTSYAAARTTIDREGLTIAGQPVDVTGDEADLVLYVNDHTAIRSIRVYTGESGTDADYGGT